MAWWSGRGRRLCLVSLLSSLRSPARQHCLHYRIHFGEIIASHNCLFCYQTTTKEHDILIRIILIIIEKYVEKKNSWEKCWENQPPSFNVANTLKDVWIYFSYIHNLLMYVEILCDGHLIWRILYLKSSRQLKRLGNRKYFTRKWTFDNKYQRQI